jgi:Outer membrane protein beta-barrel domain
MTKQESSTSTTLPMLIALASVFLALLMSARFSQAQEIVEGPRIQVFAGYSRVQFDSKTLGFSNDTGLNGWTASAAYNFYPEFGVVGQVGGHYGPNVRVEEWLVGPQVRYSRWKIDFFGHLLFGSAQTRVSTSISEEESHRTYVVGGGFDYPISQRFSIRVIEADYFKTNSFGADQSNAKYSTGLVFRWGTVSRHKPPKLASP